MGEASEGAPPAGEGVAGECAEGAAGEGPPLLLSTAPRPAGVAAAPSLPLPPLTAAGAGGAGAGDPPQMAAAAAGEGPGVPHPRAGTASTAETTPLPGATAEATAEVNWGGAPGSGGGPARAGRGPWVPPPRPHRPRLSCPAGGEGAGSPPLPLITPPCSPWSPPGRGGGAPTGADPPWGSEAGEGPPPPPLIVLPPLQNGCGAKGAARDPPRNGGDGGEGPPLPPKWLEGTEGLPSEMVREEPPQKWLQGS